MTFRDALISTSPARRAGPTVGEQDEVVLLVNHTETIQEAWRGPKRVELRSVHEEVRKARTGENGEALGPRGVRCEEAFDIMRPSCQVADERERIARCDHLASEGWRGKAVEAQIGKNDVGPAGACAKEPVGVGHLSEASVGLEAVRKQGVGNRPDGPGRDTDT